MVNRSSERLDLVRAKTLFREQAIDHQVGEGPSMAAGFPNPWVHDDRRVQTHDVFSLRHAAPPQLFDVALEFSAERTVIPKTVDPAVNL